MVIFEINIVINLTENLWKVNLLVINNVNLKISALNIKVYI